ncbi:MAG: MFS transporter [Kiritimatiellales bacterium]
MFKRREKKLQLSPDQEDLCGHITDKNILNRDRIKFGIASIMYQSEESAFGPVHNVIIRAMGGTDIAQGILFAGMSQSQSVTQWIGSLLLRFYGSNRKAMNISLLGGAIASALLAVTMVLANILPAYMGVYLVLYIAFVFGLSGTTGMQLNVETNWIGDLTPTRLRGWFTSMKWIIAVLGGMIMLVFFGRIADWRPGFLTYMFLFIYMTITTLIAMFLMSTVTDRKPKTTVFFGKKDNPDRVNYRNPYLWRYIWFFLCWSGGRTMFWSFTTLYMIDYFGMTLSKIVPVLLISNVVSIVMLYLMGNLTDKIGTRKPLMIISGSVACSMLLWLVSAWAGLAAIIVFQVINGAAGHTHSMLSINFGLEVLPEKGRAAYFAFARILIGAGIMLFVSLGGCVMHSLRGWETTLFGSVVNHYHLYFLGCAVFSFSSVIPLMLSKPANKIDDCQPA